MSSNSDARRVSKIVQLLSIGVLLVGMLIIAARPAPQPGEMMNPIGPWMFIGGGAASIVVWIHRWIWLD